MNKKPPFGKKRSTTLKKRKSTKVGGDIESHTAFQYILSIGYEIETNFLSKLTLIEDVNETTGKLEKVLLNTNTNTGHIATMNEQQGEFDEDDEDFEENLLRQQELTKTDALDKSGVNVDKDVSFLITNDMTTSAFQKMLNKICSIEESIIKNDLYTFRTDLGNEYRLKFLNTAEQDCSTFSDVEWVITYYKPLVSKNVILDTFTNAIQNLIRHLDALEKTKGQLLMNTEDNENANHKIVVGHPENRSFFHYPGTNLYYLQSNYNVNDLNVDDICLTIQMTFAAKISNLFFIMKELILDSLKTFQCSVPLSQERLQLLKKIEYCVKELISHYNNDVEPAYQILPSKTNTKQKYLYSCIKNYLALILYKLSIYYNVFLEKKRNFKKEGKDPQKNPIYFKDSLFLNPRHSNYQFYMELKKCLEEYFGPSLQNLEEEEKNRVIVQLIRKLILQPAILNELLIKDKTMVRKNAFESSNILENGSVSYGNPYNSLASYLQFFEEPVKNDTNLTVKDEFIYHDWLEYNGDDRVSTRMDIHDNTILVEVRGFQRIFSTYLYHKADANLKKELDESGCNRLKKHCILGQSIGNLKKFLSLYNRSDSSGGKWMKNRKTRKHRKTLKKQSK